MGAAAIRVQRRIEAALRYSVKDNQRRKVDMPRFKGLKRVPLTLVAASATALLITSVTKADDLGATKQLLKQSNAIMSSILMLSLKKTNDGDY